MEKLNPANVRIGRNIREAREALDMGQAELARRIGFKGSVQLWRIESGKAECTTARLSRIAEELGCSVAALMDGVAPPPEPADTAQEALRIAQLGLNAAREGTPAALRRFNDAVMEHANRLRRVKR